VHDQQRSLKGARKRRPDELTKMWAVIAFVCSMPLFFLFAHRGEPGRGMIATVFAGIILIAGRLFWELRRTVSFWVAMVVTIMIHIPVVLLIPWPNVSHARGAGLSVIGLPDFFLVFGIFKLIEKTTKRRS